MKFAILSDIHSNLEAFQAVLADANGQECDRYAFLGDIVGYGPDPKACIAIVRDMGAPCVKREHDEWCATDMELYKPSPKIAKSVSWTRAQLDTDERQWLGHLQYLRVIEGFTLVHATLDGPEK